MNRIENAVPIVIAGILCSAAAFVPTASAAAAESGTAVVRVVMEPPVESEVFRFVFTGSPAGGLSVKHDGIGRLAAAPVVPGRHDSTLVQIDPDVAAAGYSLTSIRCDDSASARPSSGDLKSQQVSLEVENGEEVTCDFVFTRGACVCPKPGRWKVTNHLGSMVCTGAVSMTMPLKASTTRGTLEVLDGCSTIVASGMSEDEATLRMSAIAGCGFQGILREKRDGIPMTISFTWTVRDDERITGDLRSSVSEKGMNCEMSRDYALEFSGK